MGIWIKIFHKFDEYFINQWHKKGVFWPKIVGLLCAEKCRGIIRLCNSAEWHNIHKSLSFASWIMINKQLSFASVVYYLLYHSTSLCNLILYTFIFSGVAIKLSLFLLIVISDPSSVSSTPISSFIWGWSLYIQTIVLCF